MANALAHTSVPPKLATYGEGPPDGQWIVCIVATTPSGRCHRLILAPWDHDARTPVASQRLPRLAVVDDRLARHFWKTARKHWRPEALGGAGCRPLPVLQGA